MELGTNEVIREQTETQGHLEMHTTGTVLVFYNRGQLGHNFKWGSHISGTLALSL